MTRTTKIEDSSSWFSVATDLLVDLSLEARRTDRCRTVDDSKCLRLLLLIEHRISVVGSQRRLPSICIPQQRAGDNKFNNSSISDRPQYIRALNRVIDSPKSERTNGSLAIDSPNSEWISGAETLQTHANSMTWNRLWRHYVTLKRSLIGWIQRKPVPRSNRNSVSQLFWTSE